MDIPRPDQARKLRRRRIVTLLASLAVIALITAGLARLKPAAPSVEKASLLIDTVRRGELLRQVRGSGTLVPEQIRWIPTINPGRIEQILVWPGARVKADTVLVELSSPDLVQAAFDVESQLKGAEALDKVQMSHRTRHYPSQLSGGQQQRVAVARALAGRPAILLADEPTGNLDSKNGEAVMQLLGELHREGATICMVTHDPRFERHAERIIHLFDGRIVEAPGAPGG
jgi:ABC-type dipeptide/oligopeptide/nickel transport system ATPase component